MRRFAILVMLGLLVGAGVGGGVLALNPRQEVTWAVTATLPERVRAVTLHEGDLLVAAGEAGLFRIDAETGAVTPLFVYEGLEFTRVLLADGLAYLLGFARGERRYDLYAVDPAAGTYVRSFSLGSSVADLPGFLSRGRVVVVEGAQVRIVGAETHRHYGRVVVPGGILGGAFLEGERLYVSRGFAGGLAIIDLAPKKPALLDLIEVEDWLTDVEVGEGRVFVTGKETGLAVLDPDTRAQTPLDVQDVFVAPTGKTYALTTGALQRLGPDLLVAGEIALPADLQAELAGSHPFIVAVGERRAVVASGARLITIRWPAAG